MRIVHASTHDAWGGAAIAALRLHTGLRSIGQDSTLFVANKTGDGRGVVTFDPPRDLRSRLVRTARRKSLAREANRVAKSRPDHTELFSDDRSQHGAAPLAQMPPCDVLQLHWISEFLDCESLFHWAPGRMPVVWTLHDMNPFTGGCHFDAGCEKHRNHCGACPKLGSEDENDFSRQVWSRRQAAYVRMPSTQLHLVAPCRWVADEVKQSSLLGRFPVTIIPYGVDVDAFSPRDRAFARSVLGLPQDAKVLLFAAHTVGERRKGFSFLMEAVSGMREVENLHLLSVGGYSNLQESGIPYRSLGYVSNERLLSLVYSAADLCVVPTLQETGPMIAMESIACGTPVVGFPAGDMPGIVREGVTGRLVPSRDSDALREAIQNLLGSPQLANMRVACREVAVGEYSLQILASRYVKLYESMLAKN